MLLSQLLSILRLVIVPLKEIFEEIFRITHFSTELLSTAHTKIFSAINFHIDLERTA